MTFTVLARDPDRGVIGAATASRSLAVGASVIAVDPRVGAVASQAWTNRALRGLMIDDMRTGESAEATVARVPRWDDDAELRQVLALPWEGRGAGRSGSSISAWAGHAVRPDAVFAGNLLAGADVIEAMVEAWESTRGADLGARLLTVLSAGEAHGGDVRGRQSAAMLVSSRRDVLLDVRVDDHDDPLGELARLRRLAAGSLDAVHAPLDPLPRP